MSEKIWKVGVVFLLVLVFIALGADPDDFGGSPAVKPIDMCLYGVTACR